MQKKKNPQWWYKDETYVNFPELCDIRTVVRGKSQDGVFYVKQFARVVFDHNIRGMEMTVWKSLVMEEFQGLHQDREVR